MLQVTRILSALASAVPLLLAGAASAQDAPSGTIQFSSTKVGVGIGVQWGGGTLTLADGSTHEFKIDGLSLADLGISSVEASSEVYNLKDVKEFPGSYTAPQAGAALIKGAGWTEMKNGYGVVMTVKAAKEGVQLTLGPGGVDIVMAE